MWPVVIGIMRRYVPYITLPFATVIGFVGYKVEGWVSDRYTPAADSIVQQRQERMLENLDTNVTKRKHNPLEVNLSWTFSVAPRSPKSLGGPRDRPRARKVRRNHRRENLFSQTLAHR